MASEGNCKTGVSPLAQANNHLASLLYKSLAEKESGKNVFFSPFSVSVALSMAYSGSSGETEKEMRQVLGYDLGSLNMEGVTNAFKDFLQKLASQTVDYSLVCANSVISHHKYGVREEYKTVMAKCFDALWQEVDFAADSQGAVKTINSWVQEKTNDKIPQLLDSLNPSTIMVIVNAVYFKGLWLNQFKEKDTFMQYFYNHGEEDDAKLVEMMHLKGRFPYLEEETFQAAQLPYRGKEVAMFILLPKDKKGLAALETTISASLVHDMKQKMREVKVEVALPKMKLEYSVSLERIFQDLGMKCAFNSRADFGGIFTDPEGACISEVVHKAVLEVNEEGCEAAAATAVVMVRCCIMQDPEFIVDRPFALVLYNLKEDVILFMGRVYKL